MAISSILTQISRGQRAWQAGVSFGEVKLTEASQF